jgi:pimeloyl-ACP methyl ester carboxylesterase
LKRSSGSILLVVVCFIFVLGVFYPIAVTSASLSNQSPTAEIVLLDRNQSPVSKITDGDQIQIRINLAEKVNAPLTVEFNLDGDNLTIGTCEIRGSSTGCQTEPLASLGWHWQANGRGRENRTIQASAAGVSIGLSAIIQVAPRPVVMVHGFSSSWVAWENYLGPSGFLAANGIQGYAVGDEKVPGVMDTGNFSAPTQRTKTIAENAAILGEYIANVKKLTGAQEVDLVSHSMGGLISRYYIDRVMKERDVAQLIMLGSPMAGTDCANLPAALGLYLPATLELRPSYVREIFDQQVTHRHGVPFHALAGVPIVDAFKSPCTVVPSDLAVSLDSVTAIPLETTRMPVLHMDLNTSEEVFKEFVKPLLQTPSSGFPDEPDPLQAVPTQSTLQFTRVYTGHVGLGSSQEISINIEAGVTVASFALYDTTRSLAVSVRGASGNVIALSSENNGLVVVQDPSTLFYLGYGFHNPKPGTWRVTLTTTEKTPLDGADYALTAYFVGGAELKAGLNNLIPMVYDEVQISTSLSLSAQALDITSAQALIHAPDGKTNTIDLAINGAQAGTSWKPDTPGIYGIDIRVTGNGLANMPVERTAFLSLEVQPRAGVSSGKIFFLAAILVACFILFVIILAGILIWRRKVHRG